MGDGGAIQLDIGIVVSNLGGNSSQEGINLTAYSPCLALIF
jgi:hypothetical protein